jgi:hypothetical protein
MQLGELLTLLAPLDPQLQFGMEAKPPTPITAVIPTDSRLILAVEIDGTPLTINQFRTLVTEADPQLTVQTAQHDRLFGFRQSQRWLLFK